MEDANWTYGWVGSHIYRLYIVHWWLTETGEIKTQEKTIGCFTGAGDTVSNEKVGRNFIGCGHTTGQLVAGRIARI